MKKVVAIVGPTASGKSKLAIDLALYFNGEIISCDSVSVYKDLDIGSAKPTLEEQKLVKHHLIDCLEPTEKFDVATCQQLARNLISKIDRPFICGGTGLYLNAILYNYEFNSPKRDDSFAKSYSDYSNLELYNLLKEKDPLACDKLHPNNRKRVLRALETYIKGHNLLSSFNKKDEALYDSYIIYIDIAREILYERINKRVDLMFDLGLEKEVYDLYQKGIMVDAIGYKEFIPYFEGLISLDMVKEEIKLNTRHLAKRQKTWFKNQTKANFYDVLNYDKLLEETKSDLKAFWGLK